MGPTAERVVGLGELEEVVEGVVEALELGQAGAEPGGGAAVGVCLPGLEGLDLVFELGDGRMRSAGETA